MATDGVHLILSALAGLTYAAALDERANHAGSGAAFELAMANGARLARQD